MQLKNILLCSFLMFVCAVSTFAQNSDKHFWNPNGKEPRTAQSNLETTLNLDYFLPKQKDAWTVSIISKGGISGGTKLIAGINSNGNILCLQNDPKLKTNQIPVEAFNEITRLVRSEKFLFRIDALYEENTIEHCSDCSTELLSITHRSKKNILTNLYTLDHLSHDESRLKQIYDKVAAFGICGQN